ncbi:tetratricopeptide repeat protein [Marilutibacter alkalisoli]|uniref:Tetratricopeptide repeat protein n=1 Tax=Marilutibacter alkalisoli TaxID=2591633 RepID=A0A514BR47_9GAMM|nr:tetratricopeptide repeat protein [Lysobacter alkalisoli]QDH69872.1 tetratricopeptide repeat protein [Lysobacter alkalisoli]
MTATVALFITLATVLTVLALGYVLRPLWKDARVAGAALTIALLVLSGTLYFVLGTPDALDPARRAAPETLDDAIAQLEARLAENPDQPEGWRLLGNTWITLGEGERAEQAYRKALELVPDDPGLLTELVEARAMTTPGRRIDDESIALLDRALEQDPMHQRARWFLGIAHRQAEQPAEAVKAWEPLLGVVEAATAAALREQINLARADAGMEPLPEAPIEAPTAADQTGITIAVSLDPELGLRLPPGATLFVIARQPDGPPMPVAVKKLPVTQFPIIITLGDGDGPMPTMKLSQLDTVELVARISASGNATPASGDFTSETTRVTNGEGVKAALLIDRVAP